MKSVFAFVSTSLSAVLFNNYIRKSNDNTKDKDMERPTGPVGVNTSYNIPDYRVSGPTGPQQNTPEMRWPSMETMKRAKEISKQLNKYIDLDFWADSVENKVIIGVFPNENGDTPPYSDKVLLKTEDGTTSDDYTSPISKIYGSGKEYIIVSQNAVYIVDSGIKAKKINSNNPFAPKPEDDTYNIYDMLTDNARIAASDIITETDACIAVPIVEAKWYNAEDEQLCSDSVRSPQLGSSRNKVPP